METKLSPQQLARLSDFIAQSMGLHFPPPRWPDLQRGIAAASAALGFVGDAAGCERWLASGPSMSKQQFDVLAGFLTVGETYFLREPLQFEVLTHHILPELVRDRQKGERRLRIWSAACCTGEEPYSIAISLHRAIPDLQNWQISLLATDINPQFLRKAEAGIFGQWSFRDTPGWLKEQYFKVTPGGQFKIRPEIRRMVRFAPLNLAEDAYPSLANDTNAMDVIFCRNMLMYFTPAQAKKVIHKFYRAQVERGWLIVGSSELLQVSSSPYVTVRQRDVILYQKDSRPPARLIDPPADNQIELKPARGAPVTVQDSSPNLTYPPELSPDLHSEAETLYRQGRYAEAIGILQESLANDATKLDSLNLLSRCLANQGRLAEALECCDRWIATDKLNPASQYLRALVLQEQGAIDQAAESLRSALFLDRNMVMAHIALGHIARDRGQISAAHKHLNNALELLGGYSPEDVLPESEEMTAAQCTEMIQSLMQPEAVP